MLKLVLVVHGENDPRVLIIESEVMVESIRSGSTYVDYFYLYWALDKISYLISQCWRDKSQL